MSRVMRVRRGSQRFSDPAGDPGQWAGWRLQRLLAAGFSRPLAKRLAVDARIDVHALLELVDHGCPPHLAVRIMAPLDWDPDAR